MKLDLICLGLVLFFALIGASTGAVRQVIHLAGVACGYFAARSGGASLGRQIATSTHPMVGRVVAMLLLFFGVFGLVHLFGRLVLARAEVARALRGTGDRVAGAVLGAAKATLVLWVMVSALLFFERPLLGWNYRFDTAGSGVANLVRAHNLFESPRFRWMAGLRRLVEAEKSPKAAAQLQADPAVRNLLQDARIRKLQTDKAVADAIAKDDDLALLQAPAVQELLSDPAFVEKAKGVLERLGNPRPP